MGNCHSEQSYPRPGFTLASLSDLPIGAKRDYPRGCTAAIEGSQGGSGYDYCQKRGFNWPKNGEFDFALGAGCSMCSDVGGGYGCECGGSVGGGASIGGRRCAVVRTQYLGDPLQCCIQQSGGALVNSGGTWQTCDPRYRGPGTAACKDLLRGYCDNAQNFFSPVCREYVGNLNEQYKNTLGSKYCSASNLSPSDAEWCSCFTAKVPDKYQDDPVISSLFLCLDPKCLGGKNPRALKPYQLECPTSLVQCSQEVALDLLNSGVDTASIQNQCGNISIGEDGKPTPPSPPARTIPNYVIYGGLGALLLLLILALGLFFFK